MKDPKSIIITGASSGIGAALAETYAQKGVFLALSGRNPDRLKQIAERCKAKGAEVETALVDVTNQQGMNEWIGDLCADQDIDLIIANAGISGGTSGKLDGEPVAQARQIFDVNVTGVFNTVESALKIFTQSDKVKQIAIVSSLAGFRGWPSAPAYTASKGAVRLYGEALRGALKETNVRVNVICPGFVESRMTDKNEFPMPFKIKAKKAAKIIVKGLEKNKGRIAFPLPVHGFVWLLSLLPDTFAQKILANSPSKSAIID